jgi:hypothetical protein
LLYGQNTFDHRRRSGFCSTAELYDPTTGTWKATGSMQSLHLFTLTLLQDGRGLAVDDSGTVNSPGELYNPTTGQLMPTNHKSQITYHLSLSRSR